MGELISLILPVYNVQDFLPRCLDSIINQSYSRVEIILIDDGSKDKSGQICDQYAQKDDRIKVLHTPNRGVAKARELGVQNCSGNLVSFIDPDDYLPSTSVETLYRNLSADIDLVVGGYITTTDKIEKPRTYHEQYLNNEEYTNAILKGDMQLAPWAKLYRKKLFTSSSFPQIKKGQDVLMTCEISSRVKNTKVIPQSVYYYYQRKSSTSYTYHSNNTFIKDLNVAIISIFKNSGRYEKYFDLLTRWSINNLFSVMVLNGYDSDNKEWVNNVVESSRKISLSKKEKFIIFAIKSKFWTKLIFSLAEFKRLLLGVRNV